ERDSGTSTGTNAETGQSDTSGDAGSTETSDGGTGGETSTSDDGGLSDETFIFGAAGAPSMFDPLYATDGETFRITRQMSEGLVTFTPGTADAAPALAESWESDDTGTEWTFKIRQGVTFHDGTPVDA